MAKNYLELVNEALDEAGVYLDPLTSVTFASPDDRMYIRFKKWVNQAHKELLMDRNEWQFQSRPGMIIISPRIYVEFGSRATPPPAGATYRTDETEATFEVVGTSLLEGTWAGNDAKAYIDYIELDGQYKFNESVNELTPTVDSDVFTIRDHGRYDLEVSYPDLLEANPKSFYIQSTGGSTVQDNDGGFDLRPLEYVPNGIWDDSFAVAYGGSGPPRLVTTGANGHYEFWPHPDKQYVLKFTYTAGPETLVDYDDTHSIPEESEDIIVWRAVMNYCRYDKQPELLREAKVRYQFYKNIMDANQKPRFSFGLNRFNSRYRG